MGSVSDAALAARYAKGRPQVVFCHNSTASEAWEEIFSEAAIEAELRPIIYRGLNRSIRPEPPMTSTIDDEVRNDFFESGARVVYLGEPTSGTDFEDHWVLRELEHVKGKMLVLIAPNFPRELLHDQSRGEAQVVSSAEEFKAAVRTFLGDEG